MFLDFNVISGSYHFDTQLPEKIETEDNGEKEKTEHSEEEARQENSVKKKRKYSKSICDEEDEQPGPSGLSTLAQKKSKKICFSKLVLTYALLFSASLYSNKSYTVKKTSLIL